MLQMISPEQKFLKNNEFSTTLLGMKNIKELQLLLVGIQEIESIGRQYGSVSSKSFSSLRAGKKRDKTFRK
jgi:hypothetical protein